MTFYQIVFLFFAYSFLGWVGEVLFTAVVHRKYQDRGVLSGPLCLLYGVGGLVITFALGDIREGWFFLLVFSAVYATVIEWIGGHILEYTTHTRWWDYSAMPFNLDGYVCLGASLTWGALGVVVLKWGNPLLLALYSLVPRGIWVVVLLAALVVFCVDLVGTLLAMADGVAMYFTQTAAAPQATNAPGGGLLPDGLLPSTGGTAPATGSFEGQWVLTQASANGQTIDPAAMGVQMTATFNAGGSGTIWDGEESLAFTWVQNGSTATVTEQDGYTWTFVMQADGTISVDVDGITLFMARQGGAALPSTMPPAVGGQTVTGNGFTLQVPQGWMELNEATLQQLIQTNGQAAVDAAGLSQQLQYTQSMGILLYYSADLNANMNVAQESAQGITMDTLPTLEADYAAAYASMGITNYDMAGPVEFSGRTYYTGTYDAVYPTMQYYYIVNNVFYTITLTNVSDADAAMILGSFTVNQ